MSFKDFDEDKAAAGKSGPKTDWDAVYRSVAKQCQEQYDLSETQVINGYVSVIADLGRQVLPDAEVEFKGSAADEAQAIKDIPNNYFKDGKDRNGKPVRLKCWPQETKQCVGIAIDFPDVMVDRREWFPDGEPKPLRIWLGRERWCGKEIGTVISNPTVLKLNRKLGQPSFDVKHQLYKMALDAKLIKSGEVFGPRKMHTLLGKAFQFKVQVYYRKAKDGKEYYTEYIQYVGPLSRSSVQPNIVTTPRMFELNDLGGADPTKELAHHVVDTMRRSIDWEGSKMAEAYPHRLSTFHVKVEGESKGGVPAAQEDAAPVVQKMTPVAAPQGPRITASDDEDAPF